MYPTQSFRICTQIILSILFVLSFKSIYSQYSIDSFQIGTRVIPQSGNDLIVPFKGTDLEQLSQVPELKPGEVLLRRRFSSTEYGLFIGYINENAYSRLSAFRLPQGSGSTGFVHEKYYSSEVINPDLDIPNVYFDRDFVYLENAARLFYFSDSWHTVSAETKLPSRLTIVSNPSGALISINGVERGNTPYNAGAVFSKSVVVKIQLEGYYVQEDYVETGDNQQITKTFQLQKKIQISENNTANLLTDFEKIENVDDLQQSIDDIKKHIAIQNAENERLLSEFESTYLPLSPKGKFEKTEEFLNRKLEYDIRKEQERNALKTSGSIKLKQVYEILDRATQKMDSLGQHVLLYCFDFNKDELLDTSYNADSEYYKVNITKNEGAFEFSYSGLLYVPRDIAPIFEQNVTNARLCLFYKNEALYLNRDGVRVKRFFDLFDFKVHYNDSVFRLDGNFDYSDDVKNSPEYIHMVEERKLKNEQAAKAETEMQVRKKHFADSLKQALTHKRLQWVRRILSGSLAAGTLGSGLYYNHKVQQHYEKQQKIQLEYDAASSGFESYNERYISDKNRNKNYVKYRNVFYSTAAVFIAGFVISIRF